MTVNYQQMSHSTFLYSCSNDGSKLCRDFSNTSLLTIQQLAMKELVILPTQPQVRSESAGGLKPDVMFQASCQIRRNNLTESLCQPCPSWRLKPVSLIIVLSEMRWDLIIEFKSETVLTILLSAPASCQQPAFCKKRKSGKHLSLCTRKLLTFC